MPPSDHALERRGLLALGDNTTLDAEEDTDRQGPLLASAVSGQAPPAGPQWLRGLCAPTPRALAFDKPLCASLDGFTLHAATKAGGLDVAGREALLRYVLRPPLAQERVTPRDDGLVRIALKRAYADGTVAVDMDPLSLLCRLAASVPPPRCGCSRVSEVSRKDATARHGHRGTEHHEVSERARRAARCPRTSSESGTAVLGQHCSQEESPRGGCVAHNAVVTDPRPSQPPAGRPAPEPRNPPLPGPLHTPSQPGKLALRALNQPARPRMPAATGGRRLGDQCFFRLRSPCG